MTSIISAIPSVRRTTRPKVRLGPKDHGCAMSLVAFERATGAKGYKYELIDGRLEVSTMSDPPQDSIEMLLVWLLQGYRYRHPDVINHISNKSRVFVTGRERATCPEPDIAAFHDYPHELVRQNLVKWDAINPILVVEVVSPSSDSKDYSRNVELYEQVPTIREYCIFSDEEVPGYPALLVYRRRGRKWQKPIAVAPGETYSTRLLPGFELKLDAPEE